MPDSSRSGSAPSGMALSIAGELEQQPWKSWEKAPSPSNGRGKSLAGSVTSRSTKVSKKSSKTVIRKPSQATESSYQSAKYVEDSDIEIEGVEVVQSITSKEGFNIRLPPTPVQLTTPFLSRKAIPLSSKHPEVLESRPLITEAIKTARQSGGQFTLHTARLRKQLLGKASKPQSSDVPMSDPSDPILPTEVVEPITPAPTGARKTRKTLPEGLIGGMRGIHKTQPPADLPPIPTSSTQEVEPEEPVTRQELEDLITRMNNSYTTFHVEMEQNLVTHQEATKKSEDVRSQLRGQLGLINAQSEKLQETYASVQGLMEEMTRLKNDVQTQIELLRAEADAQMGQAGMEEIRKVAKEKVTEYLDNVNIRMVYGDEWVRQVEDWCVTSFPKEWEKQLDNWDFAWGPDLKEEKQAREDFQGLMLSTLEVAEEEMDSLRKRLDREGCTCGDRVSKGKRKIVE